MTLNIPLRVSVLLIAGFWILTNADSLSIHIEMNKYYEKWMNPSPVLPDQLP